MKANPAAPAHVLPASPPRPRPRPSQPSTQPPAPPGLSIPRLAGLHWLGDGVAEPTVAVAGQRAGCPQGQGRLPVERDATGVGVWPCSQPPRPDRGMGDDGDTAPVGLGAWRSPALGRRASSGRRRGKSRRGAGGGSGDARRWPCSRPRAGAAAHAWHGPCSRAGAPGTAPMPRAACKAGGCETRGSSQRGKNPQGSLMHEGRDPPGTTAPPGTGELPSAAADDLTPVPALPEASRGAG